MRGIVILDGADGVGKTNLAHHLVREHGARYLHLGIHRDIWRWHVAAARRAIKLAETRLVVVDRLWLSEQAYGQAFRGGPGYDLGARCLDRLLQRYGAVTVLCVRRDLERHLADFERLKMERPEKFSGIGRVAQLYCDLALGNVAHPGDTYLDQLIRWGDYARRPDVMLYDMDLWPDRADQYAGLVVARLMAVQHGKPEELWRYDRGNLIGAIHKPRYLFVGEAVSPRAGTPWPFFWRDASAAAGWLNRALHQLKFDETGGLWTNAVGADPWLSHLAATIPKVRAIALGGVARLTLADKFHDVRAVSHPQWARRFRARYFDEYVDQLREAMA